jgi:hypothetical protein
MSGPVVVAVEHPIVDYHRFSQDCDKDHAYNRSFQYPKINPQADFRLLTIAPSISEDPEEFVCTLKVVLVADLPKTDYVALSYFWGEARTCKYIHVIIVNKQQYWIRTCLCTFFQATRGLTLTLPMYIDAVCLNQQDDKERAHQIKLMSEVYSHANQTHV